VKHYLDDNCNKNECNKFSKTPRLEEVTVFENKVEKSRMIFQLVINEWELCKVLVSVQYILHFFTRICLKSFNDNRFERISIFLICYL